MAKFNNQAFKEAIKEAASQAGAAAGAAAAQTGAPVISRPSGGNPFQQAIANAMPSVINKAGNALSTKPMAPPAFTGFTPQFQAPTFDVGPAPGQTPLQPSPMARPGKRAPAGWEFQTPPAPGLATAWQTALNDAIHRVPPPGIDYMQVATPEGQAAFRQARIQEQKPFTKKVDSLENYGKPRQPEQKEYYQRPEYLDTGLDDLRSLERQMNGAKAEMDMYTRMGNTVPEAARRTALGSYSAAKTRYEMAAREYLTQAEDWKSTIREEAAIQQEIEEVNKAMRDLRLNAGFGSLSLSGGTDNMTPKTKQQQAAQAQRLAALEQKRKLLADELKWRQYYDTQDIRGREDFAEKSRYNPAVKDAYYKAVNGDPEAVAWLNQSNTDPVGQPEAIKFYRANKPQVDLTYRQQQDLKFALKQIQPEEAQIFTYLYNTEGPEKAFQFLEGIQSDMNARQRQQNATDWAEYAADHKFGASFINIMRSPAKGIAFLEQSGDMLTNGVIDQNAYYNDLNSTSAAMQEAVSGEIEKTWGPVGSFTYNLGMSMAEFLLNLTIASGVSAGIGAGSKVTSAVTQGIMSSGAAADMTIEAKDRGLSDGQSIALGIVAGAAEWLTEKYSIEALLNPELLVNGTWKYVAKNMAAEGSEEIASDLINLVADVLIAGDQNKFRGTMDLYLQENPEKTEDDAFNYAFRQQLLETGLSGLGGALSGGIIGGLGAVGEIRGMKQAGSRMQQAGVTEDQITGMVESALATENETAQSVAEQIQKKLSAGEKLTSRDLGQLNLALQQARAEAYQKSQEGKTFGDRLMEQITSKMSGDIRQQEPSMQAMNAESQKITTENGVETTQAIQDQAQRMSKATGRDIVLVDEEGQNGYTANGRYERGKIYLNVRSDNPMAQIVGHELTHSLEGSEGYSDILTLVKQDLGENIGEVRRELQERYAAAGHPLNSETDIDHEMAAEWVETHLLTSEADIRSLVQQKPTFGQRVITWIDNLIAKLGNKAAKERQFLRKVRANYARALRETQQAPTTQTESTAATIPQPTTTQQESPSKPQPESVTPPQEQQAKAPEGETQEEKIESARQELAQLLENGSIDRELYEARMEALDQDEAETKGQQYSISKDQEKKLEAAYKDFQPVTQVKANFDAASRKPAQYEEDNGQFEIDATGDMMPEPSLFIQRNTLEGYAKDGYFLPFDVMFEGQRYKYEEIMLDPPTSDEVEITAVLKVANMERSPYGYTLADKGLLQAETAEKEKPVLPNVRIDNSREKQLALKQEARVISDEAREKGIPVEDLLRQDLDKYDVYGGKGPTVLWNTLAREAISNSNNAEVNAILEGAEEAGIGVREYILSQKQGRGREGTVHYNSAESLALRREDAYRQKRLQERMEAEMEDRQYQGLDVHWLDWKGKKQMREIKQKLFYAITDELDLNLYAHREYLDQAITTMVEEYVETGRISDMTIDRIFDSIYDATWTNDTEFLDEASLVKQYMLEHAITPSMAAQKSDGYERLVQKSRGLIRNSGGVDVKEAYDRLHEIAPRLFPKRKTNWEPDLLKRIVNVLDGIEKSERTTNLMTGEDLDKIFKGDRQNFQRALERVTNDLEGLRAYAVEQDRASRAETKDYEGAIEWAEKAHADGIITDEEYQGMLDAAKAWERKLRGQDQEGSADLNAEQKDPGQEQPSGKAYSRDQLTVKAQEHLGKVERSIVRHVKKALGLDSVGDRTYVFQLAQKLADKYLETGKLSAADTRELFDELYENGVIYDRDFYDQYHDIKTYLRTTAVTLDPQDRADITDYDIWRKRAFGRMRVVRNGGLSPNVMYQELNGMAPELFPENITHPADQMQRMIDVAESIHVTEHRLSEMEGDLADVYKQAARSSFEESLIDDIEELHNVRRTAEEEKAQKQKREELAPKTVEEAIEVYKSLKGLRREADRVAARVLLTERDKQQVGRLLRHEILPEDLNPATNNVKGILQLYEAKKGYEEQNKRIKAWKDILREKRNKDAEHFTASAINWQDKNAGWKYARETLRRNLLDIIPDAKDAEAVLKHYQEPIAIKEAESNRFKNEYRNKIRDLNIDQNIRPGDVVSEDAGIQIYGEATDNIRWLDLHPWEETRDGKTKEEWQAVLHNLRVENPSFDFGKIKSAVGTITAIYDEFFQRMNNVLVKEGYEPINYRAGYFPHFQEEEPDGVLGSFGRAMGIKMNVDELPTNIAGRTQTFKPGKVWFSHAQERIGYDTAYGATKGFDQYIEGVASVIFQTENIQNLRALANQIRYNSTNEEVRKRVDSVKFRKDLTEEQKHSEIEKIYKDAPFTLSNFVQDLEEYTNLLANKKSKRDREIESDLGRRIYTFVKNLESRVGANMVGANVSSAMTNFIPLSQAWGQLGSADLINGMWDTLKNMVGETDGLMQTSDYYTNLQGSDPLYMTKADKVSKVLGAPMELVNNFTAESIIRAARRRNLNANLSQYEAMHQADIFTAALMGDRSRGGMPTLFGAKNPLLKAFTQFQLEVNNEVSVITKDMPRAAGERKRKRLAAMYLKYALGAWLFNQVFEKLFGRKPAFSPLDMLNDSVGDFTGYKMPNPLDIFDDRFTFQTEKKNTNEAIKGIGTNALGALPFSGALAMAGLPVEGGRLPVASAVPNLHALIDAATEEDWAPAKRWQVAKRELEKAAYVLPPFAGGQALKTWKGLSAYFRGGSYTVDKEGNEMLQYPIYNDTPGQAAKNFLTSAVMGKNATSEARDWVAGGFRGLNARDTAIYEALSDDGMSQKEAYEFVDGLTKIPESSTQSPMEQKREYIQTADISGSRKAIAYYGLLPDGKEKDLMLRLDEQGANPGAVADTLMQFHEVEGKGKSRKKRDILLDSALTQEEKKAIYREMLLSDPTSQDAEISDFEFAGMDFDDYLEIKNAHAEINEREDLGAYEKSLEFAHWLDNRHMTKAQRDLARGTMSYYQMYAAQASRYNRMTEGGLDPEKAYKLAETWENVEGDGYETTYKKWDAVLDAGLKPEEQMVALQAIMGKDTYRKVAIAYEHGLRPEVYIKFKENYYAFDENKNGSMSNKEIDKALKSLQGSGKMTALGYKSAVSNKELAILYQLFGSWRKPSRNPYDRKVGQEVYNDLYPDKK